jgi:catechol 2,3-dioxygenase-like lactoylglutathione lyase family enzyme
MNVRHLDHINMTVSDFNQTVRWYRRVFGFELVEERVTDAVRWGVIRAGEAMLCIYEHPKLERLDRLELSSRGLHGVAHFGLRIIDADAWLETIEREKVHVLYDGEIQWPHSRSWYIKDPTGYEIEVVLWTDDRVAFDPIGPIEKR